MAAIDFADPPRIPIEDLCIPGESDIVGVGFEPAIWQWHPVSDGIQECVDLFGCVRRRHDQGIGEVYTAPLETWDAFSSFKTPDLLKLTTATLLQLNSLPPNKFVLGDLGQCFSKIFEIRGFQNALIDFALYPGRIKELTRLLAVFACERVKMYAELKNIHCISMYDDWGTQSSMLLSPAQWGELFLEEYRGLFEYIHKNGMYVYFHCCGMVKPIISDLIKIGADILKFDQPRLHGIEHLGREFAGKVAFCCPVDIQATLPTADRSAIAEEINELVRNLHRRGGFIAKIYRSWDKSDHDFDPAQYSKDRFKKITLS
jgi:uroporphyrinogen decarboxylase